jgi:hypothetical protein
MGKIHWNKIAPIGLIVFSQTAFAVPDSRVAMVVGTAGDQGIRLDRASLKRLAQAQPQVSEPASSAKSPPVDSKRPDAPKGPDAPAASSTPGTITATAVKPAASVPGCALHYLAAEIAGKLKGRKWKQFRQEECGASEVSAVFPTAIAPKYAGEKPDKAMTLTCADQFNANKADKTANANGGLKWIEKSGGYYSECIVRLKG